MRWFKALSPFDPDLKPVMDAYGFEGYGRFMAVLEYCQQFGMSEINEDILINNAKCNRRGAEKLTPMFQEILAKVYPKFSKSLPKVYPNFDQSLPKLEAQNPHGCNKNIKREERDKKETPNPLPGGSDAFEKFWAEYPRKTAKKTAKEAWGRKKLNSQLDEILVGVKAHVATEQWKRGVVPHASTFINQERWKDQLVLPGILTAPTVSTERSRYTSYEELYPEEFVT